MGWVGKSLRRKEDDRLIRGHGLFADDEVSAGMLHLFILRSPYAHARIRSIDASAAEALPGVACVLTGADVKAQCAPFMQLGPSPCDKIIDLPLAVGNPEAHRQRLRIALHTVGHHHAASSNSHPLRGFAASNGGRCVKQTDIVAQGEHNEADGNG